MAKVLDCGLHHFTLLINGLSDEPFKYMSLGSGSEDEDKTQVQLQAEISGSSLQRALCYVGTGSSVQAVWSHMFINTGSSVIGVWETGVHHKETPELEDILMRHRFHAVQNVLPRGMIEVLCSISFIDGT